VQSDLHKLLWRVRLGWVRRARLAEAIDEAASGLLARRFAPEAGLEPESSGFVNPFLVRFEEHLAWTRVRAQQGEERRAVAELESAEEALAGAQRMVAACRAWNEARRSWGELASGAGLERWPRLATVRVAERSLSVAEGFLAQGEAGKARLVVRQLQVELDRLRRRDPGDGPRRSALIRRLVSIRGGGGRGTTELSEALGRLVDEGLLDLTQRLADDWEASPEGEDQLPATDSAGALRPETRSRLRETEAEALRLAATLADLGGSAGLGAPQSTTADINTSMETGG
jgi:hypothetical protein